jgi:hypothetical protein
MSNPLVIHGNKDCLFLSQEIQDGLREKPRAILWHRKGLYGLIPAAVIQNELRVRADRKKLAEVNDLPGEYHDIELGFRWAESEKVPNGARLVTLLNEQSNDSGTGDSKEPHS